MTFPRNYERDYKRARKTKKSFSLFSRLRKKSNLDSQLRDDFEEIMIQADVGVTTQKIIERLQKHVRGKAIGYT